MSQTPFSFLCPVTGLYTIEGLGTGGGGHNGAGGAYGGGGPAYARKAAVPLVGGVHYSGAVADAAPANAAGDQSEFTAVMLAVGGQSNGFGPASPGGLAADCVGDVKWSGGKGGLPILYGDDTPNISGGGGGAADDASPGNDAVLDVGGSATARGGKGADGVHTGTGNAGDEPGGGGSGGGGSAGYGPGGPGAKGYVIIWHDLGVWPPIGQTPVATYGAPVPPFPSPANPKLRKSASIV